jgi:sulfhydrogenase subunit beta (sulfur reductase)
MIIPKLPGELREPKSYIVGAENLGQIIDGIPDDFKVIGPVYKKWAVELAPIESVSDLAFGAEVKEQRSSYRLERKPADMDLSGARPMNSPKSFNLPAREEILSIKHNNGNPEYESPDIKTDKKAFFGIHACDVAGLYVLDRTFQKRYPDPIYSKRRADTIVIGLNCLKPGANCFCPTFDTGPDLKGGFDIGLTWLNDQYLVDVATETGAAIMAKVNKEPAPPELIKVKHEKTKAARQAMTKAFDLEKALEVLNENYDHPYWNEPSERCLSCANCINVCPTCYCYQVREHTTVDQTTTNRVRSWDACQNLDFAEIHGGNFRPERVDRIRQWVNHKINWTIEQYGCSGCVGCGRCVTWCPTAIDITEPVWRLGGKGISVTD